jgi:hypothetical protein
VEGVHDLPRRLLIRLLKAEHTVGKIIVEDLKNLLYILLSVTEAITLRLQTFYKKYLIKNKIPNPKARRD